MTTSQACEPAPMSPELAVRHAHHHEIPEFSDAIDKWTGRQQTWAWRPVFAALESELPTELLAIRDHIVNDDAAIVELGGLVMAYAIPPEGEKPDQAQAMFMQAALRFGEAYAHEDPTVRSCFVDMALVDTDFSLLYALDAKQFELLEQPDFAKSFMTEVLADIPEALDEMLQFTPSDTQQQHKTNDQKVTLLAQVMYRIRNNLPPKEMVSWLYKPKSELGQKSPYEVINQPKYDSYEHRLLMDLAQRTNAV